MNYVSAALASLTFCSVLLSAPSDIQKTIEPWGRETVENTKAFFSQYQSIVKVRVDSDRWVSKAAPQLSHHHYKARVLKIYKGNWKTGETISFVTHHDGQAPTKPAKVKGDLRILLTNAGTDSEIAVDTGELLPFQKELEPALAHLYPSP